MDMKAIEIVIGAVMPLILELLVKYVKSTKGKFAVSLVLPLVIGAILNIDALSFGNVEAVLASGAVIFTAAQVVYKSYFRDSGLQKRLSS